MQRRLNTRLLLCLLGALGALCISVHFLHAYQVRHHAATLKAQAARAEEEGRLGQAATYWNRYLAFAPGDTDALAKFGLALAPGADSPRTRGQLLSVFEQVLDRDPAREDIRQQTVRLALDLGLFADAGKHLQVLLLSSPENGEWHGLLGRCHEADGRYKDAAAAYEQAVRFAPQQIDPYVRLAVLLRFQLNRRDQAGKVMDDLVASNPMSSQAYLERARYRRSDGSPAEAVRDLQRARALAPTDAEVLLTTADVAHDLGKPEEARQALREGLLAHPRDVRVHLRLARVEEATRPEEAVAVLRQALRVLPDEADLLFALGNLLMDRGELKEVETTATRLRDARQPILADYVNARLRIQKKEWAEAARLLGDVASSLAAPEPAGQAYVLLGQCYEHLGEREAQLAAYRQALALDASSTAARLGVASTLLDLGKTDDALTACREITHLPKPPDAGWTLLARAVLQRNLHLPAKNRDWRELDRTLARAEQSPAQAVPAAILKAEALSAQDQWEQARAVLTAARDRQPKEVKLWTALADLALRQGNFATAAGILSEAQRQLPNGIELRLARLKYWVQHGGSQAGKALAELEQGLDPFGPAEQRRFLLTVADAYLRIGNLPAAERLCQQLVERQPDDLRARLQRFDVLLHSGTPEAIRQAVADIQRLEGKDGALGRYAEAARLVVTAGPGEKQSLAEARTLLAELGRRHPSWSRVAVLQANLDEREGKPDDALTDYLRAIDLGDGQLPVIRRTILLLLERGRYLDADQVLRKQQQQGPLARDFARPAAEIALRMRDSERALTLARQAMPSRSRDHRDYLWLSEFLAAAGQHDEAEKTLRHAIALAEAIPDTWVALVHFLARTNQPDRAEAVIAEARQKLAPDQVSLTLARCYEALCRVELAEEYYRAALSARPSDVFLTQRTAAFYLHFDQRPKAVPLLRKLLDPALAAPEEMTAWARRRLAMELAAAGGEPGYREALELVGGPNQTGGSLAERRARALVLATRPAGRRAAFRLLEDSLAQGPLAPEEQLRLARLYDEEDIRPKVREHLTSLLALDERNPAYLAYYAGRLLRWGRMEEARAWAAKLEKVEPDSPRTRELKQHLSQTAEAARRR